MSLFVYLDYAGIALFAATGALAASRKQLDLIGFLFFAAVTGARRRHGAGHRPRPHAGLLGAEPDLYSSAASVGVFVFFTAHRVESRFRLLIWLDAIGLPPIA
jgi:uncharacterized membrane protein YeiH